LRCGGGRFGIIPSYMKQDFKTEELKTAIEDSVGFRLEDLARLPGRANSFNFIARSASGERFVVKCMPWPAKGGAIRLAAHLKELEGSKAVRRVHPQAMERFSHYAVFCLSLCEGRRMMPDELSADELRTFLRDYLDFSEALQKTSLTLPAMEPQSNMRNVQAMFHGPLASRLKAEVARFMAAEDLTYRSDATRVIHGDFHHGNFLFKDGALSGIFDLEEFRFGYPAEDIVRYFVCAHEHLHWCDGARRCAIVRAFDEAVRFLPYSRHEWLLAIHGLQLRMMESKAERGYGPFGTLDLRRKGRLYDALREIVKRQARG